MSRKIASNKYLKEKKKNLTPQFFPKAICIIQQQQYNTS